MTPRRVGLLILAVIVAGALGWALMEGLARVLGTPAPGSPDAATQSTATPAAAPGPAVPKIKATLYFASEDGLHLVPTPSDVPLADTVVGQARAILETQLSAQPAAPLASTIPPGTLLRGVFVSERNEVFVDLDPAVRTAHTGGSLDELLTVYTIVNVLTTNLPTLEQVQILIDGREADTLAGHVDLRRPLRKNDSLILSTNP